MSAVQSTKDKKEKSVHSSGGSKDDKDRRVTEEVGYKRQKEVNKSTKKAKKVKEQEIDSSGSCSSNNSSTSSDSELSSSSSDSSSTVIRKRRVDDLNVTYNLSKATNFADCFGSKNDKQNYFLFERELRRYPRQMKKVLKFKKVENCLRYIFDTSKNSFENFVNSSPQDKSNILELVRYIDSFDTKLLVYCNPKIIECLVDDFYKKTFSYIIPKREYLYKKRLKSMYE